MRKVGKGLRLALLGLLVVALVGAAFVWPAADKAMASYGFSKWLWSGPTTDIPLMTQTEWVIGIGLGNEGPDTWTDIVVTDILPGEFVLVDYWTLIDDGATQAPVGTVDIKVKGKSTHIEWTIDELTPGEIVTLVLQVQTREKKKGFAFTTPGTYWLNEGATLEYWVDGVLFTAQTDGISVSTVPFEDD
jgi:hypothetical protein